MSKPNEYSCESCGHRWIGADRRCPNGCSTLAKSEGEFTRKTFQGDDTDLKKAR